MPDMTKKDEDPADVVARHTGGPDCPECQHPEADHVPYVGSRSWFWDKRITHMFLFAIPGAPLLYATLQLAKPEITVDLPGKDQAKVDAVYSMPGAGQSTADAVRVTLTDPGVMDRLIAAGPALGLGLILAVVVYALWRIEINLSSTGRYTEKDDRILRRATKLMWHGFWVLLALEIAIGLWWHEAPKEDAWPLAPVNAPFDHASMMALMASGVLAIVGRIYRSGARAHRELETAV